MKTKTNLFLASTTAVALLAGVSFAAAQSQGEHMGGAGSAGVTKAAPNGAEHGAAGGAMPHNAPTGRAGEHTGQMNSGQRSSQSERMGRSRGENTGQADKEHAGDNERTQHNSRMEENGREMQNRAQERRGHENQAQGREQNERTGQQGQSAGQNERSGQNERRGGAARENTGNAPVRVNVTGQQRTEIRSKLVEHSSAHKLNRSDIHFSLSVGTRVPHSVHLYELPTAIVTIVPEYRGFRYVLVGDEIVIIDPVTWEIVTIIT